MYINNPSNVDWKQPGLLPDTTSAHFSYNLLNDYLNFSSQTAFFCFSAFLACTQFKLMSSKDVAIPSAEIPPECNLK